MSQVINNELLIINPNPGLIIIEGDLAAANADQFAQCLLALTPEASGEITVDLRGLDIDDGTAIAIAVNVIRQLHARTSKLILIGAPQMLGHNLYRIGLLDRGHLELVDMRQDEPAGY